MRIKISHETRYHYDAPAAGVIQTLRLTPRNHEGQYVVHWRIDVSEDSRLDEHEDAFGNITHTFSADGPFADLALHVEGEGIDTLFQEFYHDIVGPYWPPERRFVEEGYRGLAFPFAELSPPPFNMEEQWERARLLGYLSTWSATGRYADDKGVDPVEALEERLRPLWVDAPSTRTVTWPLAMRVGRKR